MTDPLPRPAPANERAFPQQVLLVYGIGLLFLMLLGTLWFGAEALLLLFACALFAVLLHELSRRLATRLHLRRSMALGLVLLLLAVLMGVGGWLAAPAIADQATELASAVPQAIERLRKAVEHNPLLRTVSNQLPDAKQMGSQLAAMAPKAGLFFSGVAGALGNAVIILAVGIYFAAQPALYVDGFIRLVPPSRRARAREVLDQIGDTLARWLVGKLASMVIVGVASATGLWLLDVPLALILGLIAGLLDFIPYLGPLMAGVPAALIAFSSSPQLALYVVLLLAGIQLVEGYLLSPLIEAKTVALPPALTIAMQMVFGALFGLAGVALATPLAAVLSVLVMTLYVRDVLNDMD